MNGYYGILLKLRQYKANYPTLDQAYIFQTTFRNKIHYIQKIVGYYTRINYLLITKFHWYVKQIGFIYDSTHFVKQLL